MTISGSIHSPNSMPSPRTWSTSGPSPSGQTAGSTVQSPSPPVSSRRSRNQPSSSTNRSTPIRAARSAMALSRPQVVVEVDRLPHVQHDRLERRGARAGCAGGCARRRPVRRGRRSRPRRAPTGWSSSRRLGRRTSPGSSSSPPPIVVPVAASRSTRSTELPLHATCTPSTSPYVVEKPGVPSTAIVAPPRPGRPNRDSRSQRPSVTWWRCGLRSRSWRPVKSSTSTRWSSAGHHHLEPVEVVGVAAGVGQGVAQPQAAAGEALHLGEQAEPGRLVDELDLEPVAVLADLLAGELRRPVEAAVALAAQVGSGEPAAGVLAEEREAGAVGEQGSGRTRRHRADRPRARRGTRRARGPARCPSSCPGGHGGRAWAQ